MADNKKSIIVYSDWIELFDSLSDEEAGKLVKHFFRYVNDLNPVAPDRITELSFIPIKQTLKRDLKKWECIKVKRSEAGKKSAEVRKQNSTNSTSVENVEQNSTNSTVSVSDSVSVSVNDILLEKETKDVCSIDWDNLKEFFTKHTGKKALVVNEKTKKQFRDRLKDGYSKDDIKTAIINASKDQFHIDTGLKHITLEFISKPDKFEKFATMKNIILKKNE